MNKELFNMLLEEKKEYVLISAGVKEVEVCYYNGFFRNILSYFFVKLKDKKVYSLSYWIIFRKDIVERLYDKKLCKIKFIR